MKNKKINKTSLITILLAVLGVCLLLVGGIGGARAVLVPDAVEYDETLQASKVDVELYENDSLVSGKDTLLSALQEKPFAVGKHYPEVLKVKNPDASVDSYVRVTLYKYWTITETSEDGETIITKRVDLDPSLIEFDIPEQDPDDPDWIEKTPEKNSPESRVFYYTKKLSAGKETTPVINAIFAKYELDNYVTQTIVKEKGPDNITRTTITSTYQYDGLTLNLEASVDAIQASHVEDAMKASWGVDVTMSGDTIASIN